jgi:hypothetical protein
MSMTQLEHAMKTWILAILIVAVASAPAATAAEPTPQQPARPSSTTPQTAPARPASEAPAPAADTEHGATLMDEEAIEAELDLLVTRMSDSEGKAKIDAMAELLATLVRQHRVACAATRGPAGADARGGCCQGAAVHDEGESAQQPTRPE